MIFSLGQGSGTLFPRILVESNFPVIFPERDPLLESRHARYFSHVTLATSVKSCKIIGNPWKCPLFGPHFCPSLRRGGPQCTFSYILIYIIYNCGARTAVPMGFAKIQEIRGNTPFLDPIFALPCAGGAPGRPVPPYTNIYSIQRPQTAQGIA